ncbi:MAG: hypothetical protein WDA53_07590 [Bacillota bacterium]
MILKRLAILLIPLFILSGCSSSAITKVEKPEGNEIANIRTEKNLGQQNEKKDNFGADDSPASGAVAINDMGDAGEEKSEAEDKEEGERETKAIKIIPMAELPELTMEPQTPFTEDEMSSAGNSFMLTPVYFDAFRYQIRKFTANPSMLVIDIGNTSDETIRIRDENLGYSLCSRDGDEISGSKLQNAPISIPPGEIKRVVLTAAHGDAKFVYIDINGVETSTSYPYHIEECTISDASPYDNYSSVFKTNDNDGLEFMVASYPKELIGNGKFKAMVSGLTVVENEKIGPLEKGEGFIALVKIKMANTTDEKMKIEKLISSSEWIMTEFGEEELAVLGKEGLPLSIEPNSIVEGHVPVRIGKGNHAYAAIFYTNLGNFLFENIQGYPQFNEIMP